MSLLQRRFSRRGFLVAMAALAAGAGGWFLFGRKGTPRLPSLHLGDSHDLSGPEPYDVIIIGSGFAGTVLGRDLVQAGYRTLILESGMAPGGPIDGRVGGLEVYESEGDTEYPLASTRIRAVGGTSLMWTGRCDRLHPLDFERNAYTPAGAAWPIGYAEMDPYYTRAERTLNVRGGRLSAFSPPRKHGFPHQAEWWRVAGLNSMLGKIGVALDESPVSRGAEGDSTMRVQRDLLPAFTASPLGHLVPLITATRLLTDANGRVTGLETKNLDGQARVLRARAYVVACGGVESPRLLLLSRSERAPEGIGNQSGLVGRCFMEHPNVSFSGKVPGMWQLMPLEISRCHQYYESFKRDGLGSVLLVFKRTRQEPGWLDIGASIEMKSSGTNAVSLAPDRVDALGDPGTRLRFDFSEEDRKTLDRTRTLIRSLYQKLGARDVTEGALDWSHHHMGTCRMGDDPRTSVTDRDLRVHGLQNLYVLGSSVFVTAGASHPTPLIVALAHRLSDHLSSRLRTLTA
ncbi:MAG TPA: GMC family oxidoreductase [Candidatus Eisenbacteria bacterium]